jgi:hypothetical protein
VPQEEKKSAIDEEALAKRKAEREAKQKAAEEAAEKKRAAIEALVVLPETLPKDLEKACNDVAKAHDAAMQRLAQGDAAAAWATAKENQLPMTIVQCSQGDSLEAAGCQKSALDKAGPEIADDLQALLRGCLEKFGKKGRPPASGAMPRPRPK